MTCGLLNPKVTFEFKWNPKEQAKQPKQFAASYPDSSFAVVNPDNMDEFLL